MENLSQNDRPSSQNVIDEATSSEYKYGFTSDIDTEIVPPGLSEETVRLISRLKGEPEWLLEFRLKAFRHWLSLTPPEWAHLDIPEIDFQAISYYAAPKKKNSKRVLMKSTLNLSTHSTVSAYLCRNRSSSPGWPWMP